jgi:hypothetical protein
VAASLLAEALVRWQHAAGPFWPYVCAAPFLGTEDGETLARQALEKAVVRRRPRHHDALVAQLPLSRTRERGSGGEGVLQQLGCEVRPGPAGAGLPTVLLLDLPAEPLLAATPAFVERGWYVVPVVQRWIASPAVLPCRRLIERLTLGAWQARRPAAPRGAVLIADGERTGPPGYPSEVRGRAFDNRYEYQICRFPSTDFLLAQGVRQVAWITSPGGPAERPVRPDLAPYLEELLGAGLMVDVQTWPLPS